MSLCKVSYFVKGALIRTRVRTTYLLPLRSVLDLRNFSVLQILHVLLPSTTTRFAAPSFRVCVFAANTASGTSNTLYTSFYRYKSASLPGNRVYNSNSNASSRGVESDQHPHYSAVVARPRQRMYSAALPQRETEQRQR